MTKGYVQFIDDFDGSVDPLTVYEARVGSKRPDCSDLYLDGLLQHDDVPDELLVQVDPYFTDAASVKLCAGQTVVTNRKGYTNRLVLLKVIGFTGKKVQLEGGFMKFPKQLAVVRRRI